METFEEFCAGIVVVYIFVSAAEVLSCCLGALFIMPKIFDNDEEDETDNDENDSEEEENTTE